MIKKMILVLILCNFCLNSFAETTTTLSQDSDLYFRFLIVEHSNYRGDSNRFSISKEELDPSKTLQNFSITLPVITSGADLASMQGTVKIGSELWTFVNESIVKIGDGKLIVDSSLNVQNQKEGSIKFISKEPYPTIKVVGNHLQKVIEFIEVGITITVKPEIKNNMVGVQLDISVSEVLRESEEDNEIRVPIVSYRDMKTFVNLELGQMDLLSELTIDKKTKLYKGIPFLRNIPILGKIIFSSSQDKITKTNLYIVGGVDLSNKNNLKKFNKEKISNEKDIKKNFPFK